MAHESDGQYLAPIRVCREALTDSGGSARSSAMAPIALRRSRGSMPGYYGLSGLSGGRDPSHYKPGV